MARFLAVDVGAGTLDALFLDTDSGDQLKFVAKSPSRVLAEKIRNCRSGRILITGRQMGGGPVTEAIKARTPHCAVMMTPAAAETIHHRRERITQLGITLISPRTARQEVRKRSTSWFKAGDIIAKDIVAMLKFMGVEPIVDFLGIGVQDHGTPRGSVSSLDFRHHIFRGIIDRNPRPSAFLFAADSIPPYLRRMRAATIDAKRIPSGKVYVMDTGMAAVLGAASDPSTRGKRSIIVLDIATSHTLGALMVGGEIGGFFEYHTRAVTPEILESLIIELAEGRLSHERIISAGGHGAYTRKAVGFDEVEAILATGPKRRILSQVGIEGIILGAPYGDNMMTGPSGLIIAMAEREGVPLDGKEVGEGYHAPSGRGSLL